VKKNRQHNGQMKKQRSTKHTHKTKDWVTQPHQKPGVFVCFVWWCLMPLSVISVISWRSVLLVEETGGPGENHWPVASHRQTLSHNVVHPPPWSRFELKTSVVIGTDCIGSCKSNYHTMTAPKNQVWTQVLSCLQSN
jgi:hypothetical protein